MRLWDEELLHGDSVHEPLWGELGFRIALVSELPVSAHVQRRLGRAKPRPEFAFIGFELRVLNLGRQPILQGGAGFDCVNGRSARLRAVGGEFSSQFIPFKRLGASQELGRGAFGRPWCILCTWVAIAAIPQRLCRALVYNCRRWFVRNSKRIAVRHDSIPGGAPAFAKHSESEMTRRERTTPNPRLRNHKHDFAQ